MREHTDIHVLANWLSMMRADTKGAILLTNHDLDGRFYEKCVHQEARILPSNGKALDLLNHVRSRGIQGLVAAVQVYSEDITADNVFSPEVGDVSSILLSSNCFNTVFEDITGSAWLRSADKETGGLRSRAIFVAWQLSRLRVCIENSKETLQVEDYIDWIEFALSPPLIKRNLGLNAMDALQSSQLAAKNYTTDQMLFECDGTDVFQVLAAATLHYCPMGLSANRPTDTHNLLSLFRVAFNLHDLENDKMFWKMRRWERKHKRFVLLRKWRSLDPLNVLLDQRYWEADLKSMLKPDVMAERLTAFKMDLDNFKIVNEKLGHSGGDDAIRLYCSIVGRVLGHVAEVYRRGGDEIVAFAPDFSGQDATDLAERLRQDIEQEFAVWSIDRQLTPSPTASIGVVDVAPGTLHDTVVQMMDEAQSKAKDEGKNRVIILTT